MKREQIVNIVMVVLVITVVIGSGLLVYKNLLDKEARERKIALEKTSRQFEDFVILRPLEDAAAMATEGFIMYKGKMYKTEKEDITAMSANVQLPNETKVMVDGRIIKKDGTSRVLKDNEMINLNGVIMPANRDLSKIIILEIVAYKGARLAGSVTPFLDFNNEDYEAALAQNKVILLNFYADWCPICRGEQPGIKQGFDQLKTDEVIGFRVNYNDSSTDEVEKRLAKQFGVTYQHTKVILKNGKSILKTEDVWNANQLVTNVTNNL